MKSHPLCVDAEPISGERIGWIAGKLARLCLPISFFYDANAAQLAAGIKARCLNMKLLIAFSEPPLQGETNHAQDSGASPPAGPRCALPPACADTAPGVCAGPGGAAFGLTLQWRRRASVPFWEPVETLIFTRTRLVMLTHTLAKGRMVLLERLFCVFVFALR